MTTLIVTFCLYKPLLLSAELVQENRLFSFSVISIFLCLKSSFVVCYLLLYTAKLTQ